MKAEKVLCTVALVLVIIGALNWGLEVADFNLVTILSKSFGLSIEEGKKNGLEMAVYLLVALAGIVVAVQWGRGKIATCPEDDQHQA